MRLGRGGVTQPVRFFRKESQAAAVLEYAAKRRQHPGGFARRVPATERGADRADMVVSKEVPGQRVRGRLPLGQQRGDGIESAARLVAGSWSAPGEVEGGGVPVGRGLLRKKPCGGIV